MDILYCYINLYLHTFPRQPGPTVLRDCDNHMSLYKIPPVQGTSYRGMFVRETHAVIYAIFPVEHAKDVDSSFRVVI